MALIFDDPKLRNRQHVFLDRTEAGKRLGQMLLALKDESPLVLAIPAGGVPVGLEVARALEAPLDLIIIRKLPVPGNPEAGFGAITMEGDLFLNHDLVARLRLDPATIQRIAQEVKEELRRRDELFRKGRPFPNLTGKTVVLVDDGLASGYTMLAAANMVRRKGASRIIVAVPTASLSSIERLASLVDEIYCPNIREGPFFAVADAYRHWFDLGYQDVLTQLEGYPNSHEF